MFSRNLVLLAIFGVLLAGDFALGQSWSMIPMGGDGWAATPMMASGGSWAPMGGGGSGWATPMTGWNSMGGSSGWGAPMGSGTWTSMAGSSWSTRKK
ncbi:hypothetical protein TYRP_006348 [Tyrophagus putrescentiae]|nr:hypothetical protein TYRP_006348 [Tyrophagus putrescentiae]